MGLRGRITRLEEISSLGGAECPRCFGTTIVTVNGEPEHVSRDGRSFSDEEARAFVAEEQQDGRCPVCGAERQEVPVGWWGAEP